MTIENVGTLEIEVQNFTVRSMPGYLLTVLSAPPNSLTSVVFARLAAAVAAMPASPPAPSPPTGGA